VGRYYYALYWPLGRLVYSCTGRRATTVVRFETQWERDEWVLSGPVDVEADGHREPISGSDPQVRRLRRNEAKEDRAAFAAKEEV